MKCALYHMYTRTIILTEECEELFMNSPQLFSPFVPNEKANRSSKRTHELEEKEEEEEEEEEHALAGASLLEFLE